ncbi:transcriptional regulator [Ralstonia pseudosolanacearum]|uniref:helix-turn-helix domain-containing protein n=1 Tax=Ralstonia pseudosolanacearum TaxID=1310165 RepID=UPI000B99F39B|nr:transcriptional regulator [Ralstonia pseudosolanacearum]
MPDFEKSLLRLKEQLGVSTDKEAADLLGMSDKALNARKRRDSFPMTEVFALAAQRPELGLDPDWIITGTSSKVETADRREASLLQCFRKLNDKDQVRLLGMALLWSGEMELALPKKPEGQA